MDLQAVQSIWKQLGTVKIIQYVGLFILLNLSGGFVLTLVLGYTLYKTIELLENQQQLDKSDLAKSLKLWTLLASLVIFQWCDMLLGYLPLYSALKALFLILACIPEFEIASLWYEQVVKRIYLLAGQRDDKPKTQMDSNDNMV